MASNPPEVRGTEPFVDDVARCQIAAHDTHVGKRGAHLKYQERTVAICVSHRPGLFTERYFHHGIDLNAQVGTYNVTSNSARSWFVGFADKRFRADSTATTYAVSQAMVVWRTPLGVH